MKDDVREVLLAGGHDSGPVVRIGDTVRRRVAPWTPSVHALLQHLEAVGFEGAPRVLGTDDDGREVLTFVPGTDGRVARCYDDGALAAVAQMIRAFHDAVATFSPSPGSRWRPAPRAPHGELLCHGDLSPANTIYGDGRPQAFIDWDFATPSTAVWDLSYAVRTFVPLYSPEDCEQFGYTPGQRTSRLQLFCEAYGMTKQTRSELLPAVRDRLEIEGSPFALRCRKTLHEQWDLWRRATLQ